MEGKEGSEREERDKGREGIGINTLERMKGRMERGREGE